MVYDIVEAVQTHCTMVTIKCVHDRHIITNGSGIFNYQYA